MDYLPDLMFVGGTSSFRHLQALTLVKILSVASTFTLGSECGLEGETPRHRSTEIPCF